MTLRLLLIVAVFTGSVWNFSCTNTVDNEDKQPLARVFDEELYYEDIEEIIPGNLSPEDSIQQVSHIIEFWIRKQLLIKKAELNLTAEQKDVTEQLEDYRASLLIHKYKQKFTDQKLDTTISEDDIEAYFDLHANEFRLTSNTVKALFIMIPNDAPNLTQIKRLYKSNREADLLNLEDYCYQVARKFDDFDNKWIYFSQLMNLLPISIPKQEQFLQTRKSIEAEDSSYQYFLNIREYRLKGDTVPLDFVKGNIKGIILNKRKNQLLDDLENNLYQDALNHDNVEVYEEPSE